MNSSVLLDNTEQKCVVRIKKPLNDDFKKYFITGKEYNLQIENGTGFYDRRLNLTAENNVIYQIYFYRNGSHDNGENFDDIFDIIKHYCVYN